MSEFRGTLESPVGLLQLEAAQQGLSAVCFPHRTPDPTARTRNHPHITEAKQQSKTPLLIAGVLAAIIAIVFLLPSDDKNATHQQGQQSASESAFNGKDNPTKTNPRTSTEKNTENTLKSGESNDKNNNMVVIDSKPSGADIFMEGELIGTTPHDIKVDPVNGQLVTLKLNGYEAKQLKLSVDSPTPSPKLTPIASTSKPKVKTKKRSGKKIKAAPGKKTSSQKHKKLGSGPVNPF